ncbi:MAG: bifunctional 5,10-methylenetetrahydrofolate dehydrogenase/5,10-methenyltetrahydrofolate cyclohydrolase [Acidobacteria bacterium]|nr:bifunctional 5,10-methylenetetrahydrofolate dehydrogenase/5,10-methenyltetrahydrofolate cyclohydrolase [Acidobacteriota bacterium]MBI3656832.1 bifunctional 5,10-methylenetetrahydrofolate dehydrogenase/5,10-methenyltetrahydrofolate cyclohydrolase [Acidobacteriota bacterium]
MTARIIDGIRIANDIKEEVRHQVDALKQQGITPGLAAILVGENPSSQIYVANKVKTCQALGLYSEKLEFPAAITTSQLLAQIWSLNERNDIDGILVQAPLPDHVDKRAVFNAVSPAKDVDGFHPQSVGNLCIGTESLQPCTPAGVIEMLRREGVTLAGQRAVVVGRSDIVGKPLALLLMHHHATVTICHSRTRDLPAVCREGDLLFAAMGRAAMITEEFVKPGALVIDVGINRLSDPAKVAAIFGHEPKRMEAFRKNGYTLIGDVNPTSIAPVASAYTPVPGGVGPLTIAMLMKNTVKAARLRRT